MGRDRRESCEVKICEKDSLIEKYTLRKTSLHTNHGWFRFITVLFTSLIPIR